VKQADCEEKAEVRRLRRENRTLKMERDFPKKAAAFFAKEQDQSSS
jgi:transposase